MTSLKCFAAASMMAVPLLLANAPAEARTARQEALQGHGIYTTSKGRLQGYGGYYPRHRGFYGDRGGYGYPGYRHHRRYYGY